jgi:hypothetical protein
MSEYVTAGTEKEKQTGYIVPPFVSISSTNIRTNPAPPKTS